MNTHTRISVCSLVIHGLMYKTSVARSSRCPSVHWGPRALWVLNKRVQWTNKCTCLIKALLIFHTGLCWDWDRKYVNISTLVESSVGVIAVDMHQLINSLCLTCNLPRHIFFQTFKYLMQTLATNCPPRPITAWTHWRRGWVMRASHQLHCLCYFSKYLPVTCIPLNLLKNI